MHRIANIQYVYRYNSNLKPNTAITMNKMWREYMNIKNYLNVVDETIMNFMLFFNSKQIK